ncbi:MAG TPA: hypothetical protein VE932_15570, partial [Patescibacteria group bacterium]|nr:hypothetical protein [Patescibacteria group bacterium]
CEEVLVVIGQQNTREFHGLCSLTVREPGRLLAKLTGGTPQDRQGQLECHEALLDGELDQLGARLDPEHFHHTTLNVASMTR